jgi:tRNA pseudouridine55 synthase
MSHPPLDGILLADKPKEWTSHDVCAFVKKRFKIKKVGHAGTLDPDATGLLVLLLGQATKRSMELSGSDKVYEGVFELGVKTDSHDRSGKEIATAEWSAVTLEQIREAAKKFTGEILQMPPMVSALKQNGVRLYQLARKGVEVPRESRPVTVYEFKIEKKDGPFVTFSAAVSKGTYVRTLAHDLGETLGCYAALKELRRTKSGNFRVEDGVGIEELRQWAFEDLQNKVQFLRKYAANPID